MTKETMTVHSALAELKTIDDRIQKEIGKTKFVLANKHSNEKINGQPIETVKKDMKSSYQSITDLIKRRNALKRAVVLSNAEQVVLVGDTEYTVAEAIDMKNHGMDNYETLLFEINLQNDEATGVLEQNSGEPLEHKAEDYIRSIIQAQPKESKSAIDSKEMQTMRQTYIENNAFDLIDPIGVDKRIEELDKMITEFKTKVDAALSVSNALTTIEIEY